MSRIDICAYHEMDHAHAQEAADELAGDLARKFSIDYGWDEDVIHFERPGVHGMIAVGENEIRIQAELGIFLTFLKSRIEEEIVSYLEEHFSCTFET
jgi:putative polyhydroxyalkanoate system protein